MKQERYVESETNEGTFYKITSELIKETKCSCEGFKHRNTCKHIEQIYDFTCEDCGKRIETG